MAATGPPCACHELLQRMELSMAHAVPSWHPKTSSPSPDVQQEVESGMSCESLGDGPSLSKKVKFFHPGMLIVASQNPNPVLFAAQVSKVTDGPYLTLR